MSAPGDGPRAVRYVLVASPLLVTLFWESRVHATESWQDRCLFGLRYSLFNIAFGWWGLPSLESMLRLADWSCSEHAADETQADSEDAS